MAIFRTLVRVGVITAAAGGLAVIVLGPDRLRALGLQMQRGIGSAVDARITDPIALRAQLRDLENQYPQRIAEVRGDLAELEVQMAQLRRDREISRKVVELTTADLNQMQAVLTRAAQVAAETTDPTAVRVRFEGAAQAVSLDEGQGRAARIAQLREVHTARIGEIERDLGYLAQQHERLTGLLAQLETEHADFQSQLWTLDRQVDAIARNERMIALMEKRQRTIAEHSRYRAASLDQVRGRLADIRARQEAKLAALARASDVKDYENTARYLLDARPNHEEAWPPRSPANPPKKVLEIGPGESGPALSPGPVVQR